MRNKVFPLKHPDSSGHTSHIYPAADGMRMVKAHVQGDRKGWRSMAFHGKAILQLLSQPGAAGIRCYHAMHDGEPTLVLVAVDASGADMSDAAHITLQNGESCPPFCQPSFP